MRRKRWRDPAALSALGHRLQREAAHREKAAGAKAEAAEAAESKQQARKASLRSRREEQQRAYRQDMLGMPS